MTMGLVAAMLRAFANPANHSISLKFCYLIDHISSANLSPCYGFIAIDVSNEKASNYIENIVMYDMDKKYSG